ncbi:RNA polymerase sigma-70 factor (ECF subfamily) [Nonomuraea polychroma]|uniref:RNA polymerase sigma-70 factor (ECF subfamily) n=1 Tax=Nonomuraea polychroma TaxID=46176 RepID=A0A438M8G7_9ACTN|nr:sigma factor [Nonomuraea polychroma]RVX41915.1 RNA polymerase sigma-70 factor (ECF subfamily) [Nonomuraea polychroma]
MSQAEEFEELRPLLFAVSYRILGSVSDGEDTVQETWLRYEASPMQPTSTKAFLSAVVTRISIDVLRSTRRRREEYVGPWFPELMLTDPYEDLERSAQPTDSLSMAALLLLVRLPPLERAVFRPRFEADRREREELAGRFLEAFREGDVGGLRELLAADVHMVPDHCGKAPYATRPIIGVENVARVCAAIIPPSVQTVDPYEANGQPGAIVRDRDAKVLNTLALDILDGRIQAIRAVINPDKLGQAGRLADAWAVTREANQARWPRIDDVKWGYG